MSDQEPLPGSVFNPRQVRTLKIVVIALTIMLVLGFALLIAGLYYQASKIGEERDARETGRAPGSQAGSAGGELSVRVPAGAKVARVVAEGGRVVLHLTGPEGDEIVVVDTTRDNAITRVRLVPRERGR